MYQENDEMEIDLREIFFLLKKKLIIIISCAILCSIIAGLITFFAIEPMYSSTSRVYILTQSTSITSLADIQMGQSLTADYLELVKSRPVVERVIKNLNLDITYEKLLLKINVSSPANTRILNITVEDKDPNMAKAMANSLAKVSRRQISEIMKTDEPTVFEEGVVAKKPISPNKKMNIIIGFLLGLLLSTLAIIVLHLMDDTIKTEEDVEKYLGLNTLTVIPLKTGTKKLRKKRLLGGKK